MQRAIVKCTLDSNVHMGSVK